VNGTAVTKAIGKATASVTAPTAVAASLTYSGSAKTLFSAGSTTGGTMKYKVTTTNSKPASTADFKTTIDQGTNAGTYYLWYYVDGGDNYNTTDVNGTAVTKAIGKATATVTTAPTAKTGVKAGQNEAIVNAGTAEGGTMMYMVNATQPASTDGFSATVPTAEGLTAGTYYVWYYAKGDASHTDSEISATGIEVTIAAAGPALNLTSPAVGQVIGDDGKNYDYASLPDGVTAVAKICYVNGSHGLALALTDETGTMNWSTAISTCAAHTPAFTGGTWKLATEDEWNNMITAAGSHTALRDGFSSVGGSNLESSDWYWSSTENEGNSSNAWCYDFDGGNWAEDDKGADWYFVRACLAW